MKILFLDIDGVLNNRFTHLGPNHHTWNDWHFKGLDRSLIPHLNRIIEETGAKIVLSSTWRLHHTPEQMHARLTSAGMKPEIEIIDRTDVLNHGPIYVPRCQEIEKWLDEHPEVVDFAVLDDDGDANIPGHFVHTVHDVGLTEEDANEAIKILGKKE